MGCNLSWFLGYQETGFKDEETGFKDEETGFKDEETGFKYQKIGFKDQLHFNISFDHGFLILN
jgi:hypothetical protein